jgi:hypothetical protein
MECEAVTVTGRSQLLERCAEFDQLAEFRLARHPYLASFPEADTCTLFRVDTVLVTLSGSRLATRRSTQSMEADTAT